ncbi:MAG: NAD(P)H-hydrate dehydratase [Chlamydiae bacterium]|nr:NAD(P)H-hydrate dehydratase [Chlamydiota bacterium]
MMETIPVVSSEEMSRLEKLALAAGCKEREFMEAAGKNLAAWIVDHPRYQGKEICLLVGKGNNGGDALVAGRYLLDQGRQIVALHVYDPGECSPLCQQQRELFCQRGGRVIQDLTDLTFPEHGFFIDGLVGTGFRGAAHGKLAEVISFANRIGWPTIAIDIPSGVPGDTGLVGGIAIRAEVTFYLELPKIGFFLEQGWEYVGELVHGYFGLPTEYIQQARAEALLIKRESLPSCLSMPLRKQHKYQRGYALVVAGSHTMMGAGFLASYATLRGGAGMVRWFYPEGLDVFASHGEPEVIRVPLTPSLREVFAEETRARVLLLGPGLGREEKTFSLLRSLIEKTRLPLILDADALFFLSKNPTTSLPPKTLLTPHPGELQRLLHGYGIQGQGIPAYQQFVEQTDTLLLIKGAPNFLFAKGELPWILPFGNPGMATAGSGDVLAGILAARLCIEKDPKVAACLGCYLHGLAGDLAAQEKTVFSLTASDLLTYLPKAFAFCLAKKS